VSTLSPDRWQAVAPHLERALELPEEERAALVAALRHQDPTLATDLQSLLDEHQALVGKGFLERTAGGLPGEEAHAGQALGAYTLLSAIGQGGMGTVWRARRNDGRFDRDVAVKFPSMAWIGEAGRERFQREGHLLGRLAHPNIADLVDAGITDSGQPYLVLEHVEGDWIDRHCDERRLDVRSRIRIFLDVLSAVAHAHAHLIVHRDLKPSNVLVTREGQVKLLDFGVAKLLEDGSATGPATALTTEAGAAMTLEFAAPEQVTGGHVTTATDVYSLGVLLYLLLSGRHPAGPGPHSAAELVKAIVEKDPPRMSETVARAEAGSEAVSAIAANRTTTPARLAHLLRGDLDTIAGKTLKKEPRERYASVVVFAEELNRYIRHEPIAARPDSFAYRTARFVRRNRLSVALASLAFAAMVAGAAGTLIQARTARAQRDYALAQLSRAEAVSDLNQFILSDAAPSGKPFTVGELLQRAEHILSRQQGSDPSHVDLLISLGRQYWSQDEDASARRVLEKAYEQSRQLDEPSVQARAACALASILARGSDLARAESLVQEGIARLPDTPQFALDRIFCLLRGAEADRSAGKPGRAVDRVLSAREALSRSLLRSEILELRVSMALAESYREMSHLPEAIEIFEQCSQQLSRLGRDDTQTAGTLYNNWALALHMLGRTQDAERVFKRAIDLSRDDQGEVTVSPMLLNNYASTLENLARLDEAADYAGRAHARAVEANDQVVINQALLLQEIIYRKQGDIKSAAAMLAQVEPRLRAALPEGHYAFAVLEVKRSFHAQARGDLAEARARVDRAIQIIEASVRAGDAGGHLIPTFRLQRAALELEQQLPDAAVADAEAAVVSLTQSAGPGTLSRTLGEAYLTLGKAYQARGSSTEAREAFRTALTHLESAVGPDHPSTREARELAEQTPARP
jgi:serine/threonine protein kinase/Tfp pilus assembly protein PilF